MFGGQGLKTGLTGGASGPALSGEHPEHLASQDFFSDLKTQALHESDQTDKTNPYNYKETNSYVREIFIPQTYKYLQHYDYDTKEVTYSKYTYGTTELSDDDDAVIASWGGGWKMPTKAQFTELMNSAYTTWEYSKQGGEKGYLITSRKNGKQIFLRMNGYREENTISHETQAYYLTRECDNSTREAYVMNIKGTTNVTKEFKVMPRYHGYNIRPVYSSAGK